MTRWHVKFITQWNFDTNSISSITKAANFTSLYRYLNGEVQNWSVWLAQKLGYCKQFIASLLEVGCVRGRLQLSSFSPKMNNLEIGNDIPTHPLIPAKKFDVSVMQCLFMQQCLYEEGYSTWMRFWWIRFDLTQERFFSMMIILVCTCRFQCTVATQPSEATCSWWLTIATIVM